MFSGRLTSTTSNAPTFARSNRLRARGPPLGTKRTGTSASAGMSTRLGSPDEIIGIIVASQPASTIARNSAAARG